MKSILYLIATSLVGQMVALLCTPILSRLYSVSDFGLLGIAVSIGGVVGIALSSKSEMLMLRGDESEIERLYSNSVNLSFFLFVLSLLIVAFLSIFKLINLALAVMIVGGALGTALFSSTRVYLNVKSQYGVSGGLNALRGTGQPVLQMLLSWFSGGLVLGWSLSFIVTVKYVLRRKKIKIQQSVRDVLSEARVLVKILISALMSEASVGFLIISSGFMYSAESAGFIAMVYRVLGFPVMLVSRALSDYMLPKYKGFYNGTIEMRLLFLPLALAFMAAISIVGLFLISNEYWFTWVLGDEWAGISTYFVILAPFFSIRLISIVLSPLFIVFKKENYYLAFSAIILIGFLVMALYSYLNGSIKIIEYVGMVALYGSACYLLYIGLALGLFFYHGRKVGK